MTDETLDLGTLKTPGQWVDVARRKYDQYRADRDAYEAGTLSETAIRLHERGLAELVPHLINLTAPQQTVAPMGPEDCPGCSPSLRRACRTTAEGCVYGRTDFDSIAAEANQ